MFWRKARAIQKVNVGVTRVLITFTDNSCLVRDFYGHQDNTLVMGYMPSVYLAKQFMAEVPRRDYKVYSGDGKVMVFKDIKQVEIASTETYVLEIA